MKSTRLATTAAVSVVSLLAVCFGAIAASANSSAKQVTISVASLIPGSTKQATQQFLGRWNEAEKDARIRAFLRTRERRHESASITDSNA